MATLDKRLKDDEYRHWMKAMLCLQYTKDGLITFASKISQDLHNAVLVQMRTSGNPSVGGVCSTARIDTKRKTIKCCANCNEFLVETKRHCSDKTLNLNNSDITDLHIQPWQLAKLFMNPGQDLTNTIPGQTDLSGILNFLNRCTLAKAAILKTANIIAVKDTRNRIIHTADMKITKQDFTKNIIPTLIDLLQDPCVLSTDQVAKDAVVKIKEVAAADFHITKENEEKVLKDLATEFRCLIENLNTQINDLRKELKRRETNVGQEMETQRDKLEQEMKDREEDKQMLEKRVQTLEQRVKHDTELASTLSSDIDTIKISLKDTRQDIGDLKSEIKHLRVFLPTLVDKMYKQLKEEFKSEYEKWAADMADMKVKEKETQPIKEKTLNIATTEIQTIYDRVALSAGYKHPSRRENDKLNTFLEELGLKAGADFICSEIQDIQSAVSEMIERIKTRIN